VALLIPFEADLDDGNAGTAPKALGASLIVLSVGMDAIMNLSSIRFRGTSLSVDTESGATPVKGPLAEPLP
jgi:hypothetical protein